MSRLAQALYRGALVFSGTATGTVMLSLADLIHNNGKYSMMILDAFAKDPEQIQSVCNSFALGETASAYAQQLLESPLGTLVKDAPLNTLEQVLTPLQDPNAQQLLYEIIKESSRYHTVLDSNLGAIYQNPSLHTACYGYDPTVAAVVALGAIALTIGGFALYRIIQNRNVDAVE